jgi:D-alanyl-D-alanine carboxypeptidase (penicillin-binding protein 5/6)
MIIKKSSVVVLILFLSSVLYALPVHAEPITTDALAYILIDAGTGMVLYEKNADDRHFPASTTKILTAIIALEKGDPEQIMKASSAAIDDIGDGGMNIGINEGEEIRMNDLLNAMLIQSANDTANILAENLAPTRQNFVDRMNARAKELGAINTHFTNPSGMQDIEHYTTARDLASMARYAMTMPKFREIVAKQSYIMPATNKHQNWDPLYTTNNFLFEASEYFTKPTGIKSGYTIEAGSNLVASAVNDKGMELIAVIMGEMNQPAGKTVSDVKALIEYGFQHYSIQKLTDAGRVIKNVAVTNAKEDISIDLVTKDEFSSVLPNDAGDQNVTAVENINPDIKAPVNKGDVLGTIEYQRNGLLLGKVDLVSSVSVEKKTSPWANILKTVLIIIISFFALRITLRFVSRRLNAKRRKLPISK